MKSCIALLMALMASILIGGCASMEQAPSKPKLACLLLVNQVEAGDPDSFIFNTTIYDERDGMLLASPKCVVNVGQSVVSEALDDAASAKTATFYAGTFGALPTTRSRGIRAIMTVKHGTTPETVEVSLLLLWQVTGEGEFQIYELNIPTVAVAIGQPVLLLERADGYMALPVDLDSPESLEEAQSWSPKFGKWL